MPETFRSAPRGQRQSTIPFHSLARMALIPLSLLALTGCLSSDDTSEDQTASGSPGVALTPAPSSEYPVVVAAGDIACEPGFTVTASGCRHEFVAELIATINPEAVLVLGDNQYYCGSLAAYNGPYDASWGRFKPITKPAIGNHEYLTEPGSKEDTTCTPANEGAAGYFDYFTRTVASPLDGDTPCSTPGQPLCTGYYSFDIGTWHIVAINSNCGDAGGCSAGLPQHDWLQQDLAAHPNDAYPCTLAFWHIPLFSSGPRASPSTGPLYQLLYDNNAEVVLNGHEHNYERFAPQDASGAADAERGMRQFIAGTGGSNITAFEGIHPNSEFRDARHYGVLKLALKPDRYDWQFVAEAGEVLDSGTTLCH
jgi:hypothetical protein